MRHSSNFIEKKVCKGCKIAQITKDNSTSLTSLACDFVNLISIVSLLMLQLSCLKFTSLWLAQPGLQWPFSSPRRSSGQKSSSSAELPVISCFSTLRRFLCFGKCEDEQFWEVVPMFPGRNPSLLFGM